MDKKVLFNETLTSLVEFAAAQGNKITMDDVKLYFKDLIDDESQYNFIYDYLAINKINVEGFVPGTKSSLGIDDTTFEADDIADNSAPEQTAANVESEEELSFIKMYMEEMKAIPIAATGEVDSLVAKLLNGDLSVTERLIECNLTLVADIAKTYRGKGVNFGDLIQEGNVGLMLAISDYNVEKGNFNDFLRNRVVAAIEETINTQINSSRVGTHLADKLNRLDEVTKDLSEKLNRVPDVEELAEAMSISEEEVSQLLKISLDTLSVNEDTQITDENNSDGEIPNSDYTAPQSDPLEWRVNKK